MKNLLDELLANSKSSNEQKGFVFFNDNSPEGYTSQADFVNSLRKQKTEQPQRLIHLKKMFDHMAHYRDLLTEPSISKVEGQEVIWITFRYGKLRPSLMVLNECNLFQFVNDYANGIIRNIPNFETLINGIPQA